MLEVLMWLGFAFLISFGCVAWLIVMALVLPPIHLVAPTHPYTKAEREAAEAQEESRG